MESMFDDIRPYNEEEISAAMHRIAENEYFPIISSYLFPDRSVDQVRNLLRSIDNVYDFQVKIMHEVNRSIIKQTIAEFSYGGLENISLDRSYLYVSNHRDIMLDASLLQYILIENRIETTEISFGANLMQGEFVVDIGKANKMFCVERPSDNKRDFYFASKHLSEYIRKAICERGSSVWIAQRNGRTKDGIDHTDQGLINMFRMSCPEDKISSIADLNILPVAVSYEWEPCDMLKAAEILACRKGPYIKRAGEDMNSILTGVRQFKGRAHFEICRSVTADELDLYADSTSNDFNKQVAQLVDSRICAAYRLWPNNYIAHDMLSRSERYASFYTAEQRETFEQHLALAEAMDDGEALKEILLGIYANPVDSKERYM